MKNRDARRIVRRMVSANEWVIGLIIIFVVLVWGCPYLYVLNRTPFWKDFCLYCWFVSPFILILAGYIYFAYNKPRKVRSRLRSRLIKNVLNGDPNDDLDDLDEETIQYFL